VLNTLFADEPELHIGLYSGKDFFYKNYNAKYYNLDRRILFVISSENNEEEECKFVGHLFEDDEAWNEIKVKTNATESKTFAQKFLSFFKKAGSAIVTALEIKCPSCKEKGHVKTYRISKTFVDKVYRETTSSAISGFGGRFGTDNKPVYAWYYIYEITDSHVCEKCGNKWQTDGRVQEKN